MNHNIHIPCTKSIYQACINITSIICNHVPCITRASKTCLKHVSYHPRYKLQTSTYETCIYSWRRPEAYHHMPTDQPIKYFFNKQEMASSSRDFHISLTCPCCNSKISIPLLSQLTDVCSLLVATMDVYALLFATRGCLHPSCYNYWFLSASFYDSGFSFPCCCNFRCLHPSCCNSHMSVPILLQLLIFAPFLQQL